LPATAQPYTLSLHDALPIFHRRGGDGESLRFLVLAPFLGVVAADLHDIVGRLLRIALVVELDRARHAVVLDFADRGGDRLARGGDRKSTRLNSSHRTISYAV